MALLNERFDLMAAVSEAKQAAGVPLTDPQREQLILAKTTQFPHQQAIQKVYQCIFTEAKLLQKGRLK